MSEELIDATLRNLFIFVWLCSLIPAGLFASAPNLVTEKMEIEFLAYRLHQFESVGKIYGSKSWKVLYEAVSINESVLRKCMVLKWKDLIGMDLESKFSGQIGAVLVIIPSNFAGLTGKDKQAFFAIEQQLASIRTDLAIYFTHDSPSIQYLLRNVAMTSGKATTALQQLLNSMVADNYQISSTNSATTNTVTAKVYNVVAQLNAAERGLPHLYIVAHYDTFGIIPALAEGSDSNGSGIAVLLELLNIFSQLYALPSHRARFNLVFVLSAGGKFSYQGSRDFAERHSEESISLAICLDGLAKSGPLQVHVSKAPNSGSSASKFISILNDFSPNNQTIEMVVKKINLAAERLAWEHEIYNIRRIHGFTLSHFKNPHDPERNSLLDTFNTLDISALEQNTKLIANSLVAFVFDLNSKHCQSSRESGMECGVLNDAIRVDPQRLRTWLKMFASKPRPIVVSQQQLVSNLYEVVKRYSHNAYTAEVDINDFLLYDIIEDTMTANIVKPAIFELILAAAICTYLYGIYYLSLHAQPILEGTVTRIKKLI